MHMPPQYSPMELNVRTRRTCTHAHGQHHTNSMGMHTARMFARTTRSVPCWCMPYLCAWLIQCTSHGQRSGMHPCMAHAGRPFTQRQVGIQMPTAPKHCAERHNCRPPLPPLFANRIRPTTKQAGTMCGVGRHCHSLAQGSTQHPARTRARTRSAPPNNAPPTPRHPRPHQRAQPHQPPWHSIQPRPTAQHAASHTASRARCAPSHARAHSRGRLLSLLSLTRP